jgi:hypothetical protein
VAGIAAATTSASTINTAMAASNTLWRYSTAAAARRSIIRRCFALRES